MNLFSKFSIALKALRQLGFQQVSAYAVYKFGLWTGHYRRATRGASPAPCRELKAVMPMPGREEILKVLGEEGKASLLAEADEIAGGKARLFGGEAVRLDLSKAGKLKHWTAYEGGRVPLPLEGLAEQDVKFLWEPARFGWAFTLGRAYHVTGDEKYAAAFWKHFETFSDANPPYMGLQWMSGQEAALRLMAFTWAGQVFEAASCSTAERKRRLAESVAAHARRIPPTLVYARSQHNNHLLSEAAGLLTAGLALPDLPEAPRWRGMGWRWLNSGLQAQIDGYGEYAQHSSNYHRLMLQVVLWANALVKKFDLRWQHQTLEAVKRSIHWMLSLLDSESGQVPNLGANDGAYIFPLTICPFEEHRPVLHAAARAFLDYDLPQGVWDEMSLWYGVQGAGPRGVALPRYLGDQLYGRHSWAYFRTAQYTSRPSHADQLHLDLWWRGTNIARDAGTYLYNAPKPWDNPLATAFVHNTVSVNGGDQMKRAGRFLYLDWVNAYRMALLAENPGELQRVRGRYRGSSYRHTRIVSVEESDRWKVVDEVLPLKFWRRKGLTARLHWLLPDGEWKLEGSGSKVELRLQSLHGWIALEVRVESHEMKSEPRVSLFRAGEVLAGETEIDPIRGWTSPAYGIKIPALSLAVEAESGTEIIFISHFTFPPGEQPNQ